ncbi:MAG: 3-phosphoshikimate 1-carboxyvinyltransferase [Candidatus Paracaedibacteraceae bacterium]|nr:3-phosphoshikimate 1-carboxyvinyltransferase [Candidatus Paracaedibacteraceae bacterium]
MAIKNTLISYRQSHLRGNLIAHRDIPGDKSISHRALYLSAFAEGLTQIKGLNTGDDVEHTQLALESLGVKIENQDDGTKIVQGLAGKPLLQPKNPLYLGNSGTTARLLGGVITPFPISVTLYGDASLSQRPMRRMILPLKEIGATFDANHNETLPLTINGTNSPAEIHYTMPIPSAQIKSCLLLAGLNIQGITSIHEPIKTRDHTERLMQYLGIPLQITDHEAGGKILSITGKHRFAAKPISVPADPSSAAFFAVAAAITPQSDITIEGVNWNSYRRRVFEILEMMGAKLTLLNHRPVCGEEVADIRIESNTLNSITLEAHEAPALIDEYPALAVAAAAARGTSVFRGLRELRYKESNRLEGIFHNLTTCGIEVRTDDDTLIIKGTAGLPIFGGVTINVFKDHRIAMALYILGMIARNPIIIQGADCISSSFPNFSSVFENLSFMRAA